MHIACPAMLNAGVTTYVIAASKADANSSSFIASFDPPWMRVGAPAKLPKQFRPKRNMEVRKLWAKAVRQSPADKGMQPRKMLATVTPALEIEEMRA